MLLPKTHIVLEEDGHVSAKALSFSNGKSILYLKTYHFRKEIKGFTKTHQLRKGNSCFSQKHVIVEKVILVWITNISFLNAISCFGQKHIIVEEKSCFRQKQIISKCLYVLWNISISKRKPWFSQKYIVYKKEMHVLAECKLVSNRKSCSSPEQIILEKKITV